MAAEETSIKQIMKMLSKKSMLLRGEFWVGKFKVTIEKI